MIITRSSSDKYVLSGASFRRSDFCNYRLRCYMYATLSPSHVYYSIVLHSVIFFFFQSGDKLKSIFEFSLYGKVHPLYATPFILLVLSEKHTSMFIHKNMSRSSIMPYLWWPWNPPTWKFQVTNLVTYISVGAFFPTDLLFIFLSQFLHMFTYYDWGTCSII